MSKDIGFCSITEDICRKEGECEKCSLKHIHENIEHYAMLHEAGRLIVLPCAVGDTVYRAILGEVYEYTVGSFLVDENGVWGMSLLFKQEEKNFAANMDCDNLGKTVFLTKEEAEKRLQELQGNE